MLKYCFNKILMLERIKKILILAGMIKEDEDALDTFNLARMDADDDRQLRFADEDELADAGYEEVDDEEVDASYDSVDEDDEF